MVSEGKPCPVRHAAELAAVPAMIAVALVEEADTASWAAGSIFSMGVLGDVRERR